MASMRSLLFIPGHDARKLDKGLRSGADALIVDLEDAVPSSEKAQARGVCTDFVRQHRDTLPLFVRVNALSTGLLLDDLAAVVRARPYGIMLPKCTGGGDVALVGAYLAALEVREGLTLGSIRILPIVTEIAEALFAMGSYAQQAGPRLCGMLWGAEDLATDVGARANRDGGQYTAPFALARSLCLFAAASAGVPAIDAVFTDFRNVDALRDEAREAVQCGFSGKAAIHPAQIEPINTAFTPNEAELLAARSVVAAFANEPTMGAVSVDGRMLDRPHLRAAERLIARAGSAAADRDSKLVEPQGTS
jgi:citrate lyase subunit beta / citryl-CoA lyase